MIPFVALAFAGVGFGMLTTICGQGTADVIALFELTLLIAPHIAFVSGMWFDQFSR